MKQKRTKVKQVKEWTLVDIRMGVKWSDIKEWIDSNIIAKDDYTVDINGFYFKNETDAVMFKLKWG